MVVVGENICPDPFSIIQDHAGTNGCQPGTSRMRYRPGINAFGIPQKRTYQVEIVNTMIDDFHPGSGIKEFPEMPGSMYIDVNLDIANFADKALPDDIRGGIDEGSIPQLEIDARRHLPGARQFKDLLSHRIIIAHRLLHQDDSPLR